MMLDKARLSLGTDRCRKSLQLLHVPKDFNRTAVVPRRWARQTAAELACTRCRRKAEDAVRQEIPSEGFRRKSLQQAASLMNEPRIPL